MLNLETAQSPQKLRRVAIEPVTRIEGHGKVTILLDAENRIHQVRLHIVEFRGFEVFIQGTFNVQRHLTSAQTHRALRATAMDTWRTAVAAA